MILQGHLAHKNITGLLHVANSVQNSDKPYSDKFLRDGNVLSLWKKILKLIFRSECEHKFIKITLFIFPMSMKPNEFLSGTHGINMNIIAMRAFSWLVLISSQFSKFNVNMFIHNLNRFYNSFDSWKKADQTYYKYYLLESAIELRKFANLYDTNDGTNLEQRETERNIQGMNIATSRQILAQRRDEFLHFYPDEAELFDNYESYHETLFENSEEINRIATKAFWDKISEDITNEEYDSLIGLVQDLATELCSITESYSYKQIIESNLDHELIGQMVRNNAFTQDVVVQKLNFLEMLFSNFHAPADRSFIESRWREIQMLVASGLEQLHAEPDDDTRLPKYKNWMNNTVILMFSESFTQLRLIKQRIANLT